VCSEGVRGVEREKRGKVEVGRRRGRRKLDWGKREKWKGVVRGERTV
jgi:hypothetical protein